MRDILRHDVPHRKGWVPSSRSFHDIHKSLEDEAVELGDAIADHDRARIIEELADVVACCVHLACRLGLSDEELDAEVVRKLDLRFISSKT